MAVIEPLEIGLLVNNAGFGLAGSFFDHELRRELELVAMLRAGVRTICARQLTSVSAYIATPYEASYAASKAHELFFAEALRYELNSYGVDVLALCPGVTDTEFHDLAGSPAVAAMKVEPVVRLGLDSLGRKPVVIPGWHNRLLVYMLKCTPRRLHAFCAGRVMNNLAKT